jgi:lipopolysaccharide export LptBFGC system permease protein LptF
MIYSDNIVDVIFACIIILPLMVIVYCSIGLLIIWSEEMYRSIVQYYRNKNKELEDE